MAKLFSYGDNESQGLHYSQYLPRSITLIDPGDVEVQPLFTKLPSFPGACFIFNVMPEAELTFQLQGNASLAFDIGSDASLTYNNLAEPHFVYNVAVDASLTFNGTECN